MNLVSLAKVIIQKHGPAGPDRPITDFSIHNHRPHDIPREILEVLSINYWYSVEAIKKWNTNFNDRNFGERPKAILAGVLKKFGAYATLTSPEGKPGSKKGRWAPSSVAAVAKGQGMVPMNYEPSSSRKRAREEDADENEDGDATPNTEAAAVVRPAANGRSKQRGGRAAQRLRLSVSLPCSPPPHPPSSPRRLPPTTYTEPGTPFTPQYPNHGATESSLLTTPIQYPRAAPHQQAIFEQARYLPDPYHTQNQTQAQFNQTYDYEAWRDFRVRTLEAAEALLLLSRSAPYQPSSPWDTTEFRRTRSSPEHHAEQGETRWENRDYIPSYYPIVATSDGGDDEDGNGNGLSDYPQGSTWSNGQDMPLPQFTIPLIPRHQTNDPQAYYNHVHSRSQDHGHNQTATIPVSLDPFLNAPSESRHAPPSSTDEEFLRRIRITY
ncbi:hypothetical protein BJ085DRAFT_28595 [Dimargaris cristalligena]|uniref:Uncharacterized protein n=1 Tax=Dimargaris cristalligena TaxID=215637 RepID=A0A4P9ZYR6_9FUNG|nr:hypothetical protein BJ085DRAFT_28595 [Dimargaris cristalligena]|eukprot:RKP38518.1 hypothetical protein BJ085DRAFT_28595 [Dimargaris cristalligena]